MIMMGFLLEEFCFLIIQSPFYGNAAHQKPVSGVA
jgi:hypothetical protein